MIKLINPETHKRRKNSNKKKKKQKKKQKRRQTIKGQDSKRMYLQTNNDFLSLNEQSAVFSGSPEAHLNETTANNVTFPTLLQFS